MKKIALLLLSLIFVISIHGQDSPPTVVASGSIKIPEGLLPAPGKGMGYNGMFFLDQNAPAVIFMCNPNKDETIESLKGRLKDTALQMVSAKDVDKTEPKEWKESAIPGHKGDLPDVSKMYLYEGKEELIQLLIYERNPAGSSFLYGYFAKRDKKATDKDVKGKWADEKGNGVKLFDKFWKAMK